MFENSSSLRRTKCITLSSMVIALTLVLLYTASIVPTLRITFYVIASLLPIVLMVERKSGYAILSLIGSALLGSLLIHNKLILLPYVAFFGHFGIVKEYLERINDKVIRIASKLLYCNIATVIIYLFSFEVLFSQIDLGFSVFWLLIPLQVVFILFDWLYTKLVHIYIDKIRGVIIK